MRCEFVYPSQHSAVFFQNHLEISTCNQPPALFDSTLFVAYVWTVEHNMRSDVH